MHIQEHIPLKELTTMKIGGTARYFCSIKSVEEFGEAFLFARGKEVSVIVLGGGSNTLIASGDINALVLKIEIKGIEWATHGTDTPARRSLGAGGERSQHGSDTEQVVAGAGESWDGLVAQAVRKGLWGIENLSGIPGTVGAAPIQNIGAYGTEVKETIEWVEVFDIRTGKFRQLTNAECRFAYRDSVFKHPEGKQLIVTRVAFRLRKDGVPNLEYTDLKNYFGDLSSPPFQGGDKRGGSLPSLPQIRRAVLEIRSRKFPDLREFGTAGSFFKNPVVSTEKFDELKLKFPELPGFPIGLSPSVEGENGRGGGVKVPLAWILDNICGLKGFKKGNVALFEKQPIVLVQNGFASSAEIESFAKEISDRVKEKTGIEIEWEVAFIGGDKSHPAR